MKNDFLLMKRCTAAFALFTMLLLSCDKPEGEGGNAEIRGKIVVRNYNSNFSVLLSSYYAMEERVYIVYGDDDVYSDDFRTHYDGTYSFRYLRPGKYSVYAYSKDSTFTVPSGLVPVISEVEVTGDDETVIVPDIVILDN